MNFATILGTWQATLTDFRYLSKTWKKNCEEEALLGVSLTGIMDNAYTNGTHKDKDFTLASTLTYFKGIAVETNRESC